MLNQKGQIYVIVLVLLFLGFILYANFSGGSFLKSLFPSSPAKSTPGQETKISSPSKQEKKQSPTPGSSPAPSLSPSADQDTTPPKRFNPQPKDKSSLPPETRKITLGLETDEKATCHHSAVAGMDYDSMQGLFGQASATTSQSVLITTLSEGESYKYYIRCRDEQGNKNTDDFTISFGVKLPEDKIPPILTSPSHQGDTLAKGTKEVVISISANEPASCRYSVNAGTSYNSMSGRLNPYDQTKRFHTKNITGLQDGKTYDFFVRCQDLAKNSNTGDVMIRFSVAQ